MDGGWSADFVDLLLEPSPSGWPPSPLLLAAPLHVPCPPGNRRSFTSLPTANVLLSAHRCRVLNTPRRSLTRCPHLHLSQTTKISSVVCRVLRFLLQLNVHMKVFPIVRLIVSDDTYVPFNNLTFRYRPILRPSLLNNSVLCHNLFHVLTTPYSGIFSIDTS